MWARHFKPAAAAVEPTSSTATHARCDRKPVRSRLLSCFGTQSLLPRRPFRSRRERRAENGDLVPGEEHIRNAIVLEIPRTPIPAHPEQLVPPQKEAFLEEYDHSMLVPEGLPAPLRDQPVLYPNPLFIEAKEPVKLEQAGCHRAAMLNAQTTCSRTVTAEQVQLPVSQATVLVL